jgi:DNA-binding HxlR family transcriptional regulator
LFDLPGDIVPVMEYGQFCAVARSLEVLGERWSLLVVREVLLGAERFSGIRRGLPRIPKATLASRLRSLERSGIIERAADAGGIRYRPSESGQALLPVITELARWAIRWDRSGLQPHHLDPDALLWDMRRRLHGDALPPTPVMIEFDFTDRPPDDRRFWLRVDRTTAEVCHTDGGFGSDVTVRGTLEDLTRFWLGERGWDDLLRAGAVHVEGPTHLRRALPRWFSGYLFADMAASG